MTKHLNARYDPAKPRAWYRCPTCGNMLPRTFDYFDRNNSRIDKMQSECRLCRKDRRAKYRAENTGDDPENDLVKAALYWLAHHKHGGEELRKLFEKHAEMAYARLRHRGER